MIELTRLNAETVAIHADLIENVEAAGDTVIALTSGVKFLVREPAAEVMARVSSFRRQGGKILTKAAVSNGAAG